MQPLISIIIPTYNRAQLIGETLDSVMSQTYPNWECIVIDDSSNDYTDELLDFYIEMEPRIQYYHRPKDRQKGANACRNYGFELSKGEYIHWFDSDDIMAEDNLQEKVNFLRSNEDYDFCISKMIKFEGDFRKGKFAKNAVDFGIVNSFYEDYITGKVSILSGTPLWKKQIFKIFKQSELFDEQLFQFQDLDFYSRIISKNNRVGFLNKELIFVRRDNDSITTKNHGFDLNVDSFLKVKERILNRSSSNSVIVKYIIRDILWAMRWNMARRDYLLADKCLSLCLDYQYYLPTDLRLKLFRVRIFFKVFKLFQKGDTRFNSMLKI